MGVTTTQKKGVDIPIIRRQMSPGLADACSVIRVGLGTRGCVIDSLGPQRGKEIEMIKHPFEGTSEDQNAGF